MEKIWGKRQIFISSVVTVLNVKPYFCIFCDFFPFFFNKCSFWKLLLQIKCGTVPTVGGNGEEGEDEEEGCHFCVCTAYVYMSGCMSVCVCADEQRRMYEQPFWFSTIHLCLFLCMFSKTQNYCWNIFERTLHGTLNGLFFKGNKHVILIALTSLAPNWLWI